MHLCFANEFWIYQLKSRSMSMKLFIVITLLLMVSLSYANQKAMTDTGTEVILYEDGT